jgi:peroxin-2
VDRLLNLQLAPATRLVKREVSYEFMNRQMVWHAFTVRLPVFSPRYKLSVVCAQEFLLFVLPLLPRRALQRMTSAAMDVALHPIAAVAAIMPASVRDTLQLSAQAEIGQPRGLYWHLPETECAICHENAALALNVNPTGLAEQARPYTTTSPAPPDSPSNPGEPPTHALMTPYRTSCKHVYCYVCIADRMLRVADDGSGPWSCLRCAELVHGAERLFVEPMYWMSDGEGEDSSTWGSDYFDELGSSVSGVSGLSIGSRSWSDGGRSD